jgi:lipoate-protein ligase A
MCYVDSLSVFHAAAELGIECVIITSPDSTFVSAGYFDNVKQILDFDSLRAKNLPVFRRRIGGGIVLLDKNQVFYQVVLKRANQLIPPVVANAYRKFSKAPIQALKEIGVPVEHRLVNDLVTISSSSKISGQGAGVVGDCFVFVGNILLDFNYSLMAKVFSVSDNRRDDLLKLLEKNVSSLKREMGWMSDKREVEICLVKNFKNEYPFLKESEAPAELFEKTRTLSSFMTSEEFVFEESGRLHEKIKIREGVYLER